MAGIQSSDGASIRVWISNNTNGPIRLTPSTQIAWWEPDLAGEIALGDQLVESGRRDKNRQQFFTLTTKEDGEAWEWYEDHLHLDISRTPIGDADPKVDASILELHAAWRKAKRKLNETEETKPEARDELRVILQQLERINTRIKQYGDQNADASGDLPDDLNLTKGYEHLTKQQLRVLREVLSSEAAFFLRRASIRRSYARSNQCTST